MSELRMVELSAATIVAVNNLSLKPGQEQFLAPVSYGIAATVINPQTSWQRVILDRNEVVGFVSANFDPEAPEEHFRSVLCASTSTPTTRAAVSAGTPSRRSSTKPANAA